ncbi:LysR family transcriptional regulator [Pseudomonas sp. Leaf129]|uniref:LysR family transcriptional regulator n=1 Tax=Pseudomonas sp. Leaf129 TaxID=1736268 RepID=UPI000702848D|nr:LysR family transcriptional regulator [Pseudomonas sp. Leaf129]KQQ56791.1 LysR family transcriptional regulator [Pseudomonas sp. Leaf129]
MFDWEDLRYFCAFAGAGSLAAAARLLSVDHATVARRISSLEKSLKLKLVDRRQRAYVLTENGHRVVKLAVQISESAFAIERFAGAEQDTIEGEVIVTAPPAFVGTLIAPHVGKLYQTFPKLRLRLLATKELKSLSRREADISITLTRPNEQTSVTKRLGQLRFALYASAVYLVNAREHTFIAFDESVEDTPQQGWLKTQANGRSPVFFSNDLRIQAIAAAGHAGVALLPDYLAKEYSLVALSPDGPALTQDIWLSVHEDVKHTRRIRAVLDFLTECIQPTYRM